MQFVIRKTDSALVGDINGTLLTDSQDLEALNDYFGNRLGYISGAIVQTVEGDYSEVWITTYSRPFANNAVYEKLQWSYRKLPKRDSQPIGVYIAKRGGYLANDTFEVFDTLREAKEYAREFVTRYDDKFKAYDKRYSLNRLTLSDLKWLKVLAVGYWPSTDEEIVFIVNVSKE